jgi:hypothetical protein
MQPALRVSPDPSSDRCRGGAPGSTLAIVRLRPAANATLDDVRQVAERVRGQFLALPGLRRKYFAYSPERHEVVNVYEWHDRAAAAQVCHPDFVARIRAAYAGEPEITVAEVVAIAESTPGPART